MQRLTSEELDHRLDTVAEPNATPGDGLPVLARLLLDMPRTKRNGPPSTDGPFQVFPTPPVSSERADFHEL